MHVESYQKNRNPVDQEKILHVVSTILNLGLDEHLYINEIFSGRYPNGK